MAQRRAAWVLCVVATACTGTGDAADKAKGLKLEKAQELCLTSKALRVAAAAAETLAEAAAEKADAVAKWLAASTLAVADTHNSTAAAHAADAAAAASEAKEVQKHALLATKLGTEFAWRISDFVLTFASVSGKGDTGGYLCIAKGTHGSGDADHASATQNGDADYVGQTHLEACNETQLDEAQLSSEIIAAGARGWGQTKIGRGRDSINALLAYKGIGSALTTGISLANGGVYCPLTGHRGGTAGQSPGIIEGGSRSSNTARVVTWAGLFDMKPASALNYGTGTSAATAFAENAAGKEQFNKIGTALQEALAHSEKLAAACKKAPEACAAHATKNVETLRRELTERHRPREEEGGEEIDQQETRPQAQENTRGTKGKDKAQATGNRAQCRAQGGQWDEQRETCSAQTQAHAGDREGNAHAATARHRVAWGLSAFLAARQAHTGTRCSRT
ncbi:hypothetical protein, conserved in T. vivax [Trypanosoma vivax Y486]|uniref:Uncharacterized protein n=1 Tax=Trypanosoma vivax (strain Y486) TaxID=1055687 RepID=F9WT16_TRYVY|nr:hypothetical protein, conserved in T. vivax [Trypanosoma vivax Y486]|eukprot:CCD20705.1 hypothetical protein, conserved in T. vivax [Trypanosoma vivax Y486]